MPKSASPAHEAVAATTCRGSYPSQGGIHSPEMAGVVPLCPTAVSLLAVPDLSGSAARAAPGAIVALLGLFDELNELVVRALEQLK